MCPSILEWCARCIVECFITNFSSLPIQLDRVVLRRLRQDILILQPVTTLVLYVQVSIEHNTYP